MYDPLMKNILANFDGAATKPTKPAGSPESTNEMLDILKRFTMAESAPAHESLDKNQKSVNQLSATFKPKTVKVLGSKTDPKNPMAGKLVGGCEESEENFGTMLEDEVSEDLLSDIKRSLTDYLEQIDDMEQIDHDLKKKERCDLDLKKKDQRDRDLFAKKVKEDPTQQNPVIQPKPAPLINNTLTDNPTIMYEALKTMECNGKTFEIYGDEKSGFGVRHNGKFSPSRFKTFMEADTALELFAQRMNKGTSYKEER